MGLATEAAKRPWSQEDIEQLQILMDEDLDPVDIALQLDRSVSAVRAKMQSVRQALRLLQDAERARIDDEANKYAAPLWSTACWSR